MLWVLACVLAVSIVANLALVTHFLDVLASERSAHREETRALLARTGVPVIVGNTPAPTPTLPVPDPSKFLYDEHGLDEPFPIDEE